MIGITSCVRSLRLAQVRQIECADMRKQRAEGGVVRDLLAVRVRLGQGIHFRLGAEAGT
jgi:hypothetical protein